MGKLIGESFVQCAAITKFLFGGAFGGSVTGDCFNFKC